jgi:BMFP domain-containing protein YqiC
MSRFEATASLQLHALISDLNWRIQMLEADIAEEERNAGNADPGSSTYSMLALTLRARKDNLLTSIALLEGRLARTPDLSRAA